MPPRSFKINVPQFIIDDLHRRLDATRWPDAILGTGWEYGADVAYIRELCAYWRNEYDWRLWEGRLNAYPQFLSQIDDVDIHYWHVKSPVANAYPLLLVHGWPGSIFEFYELLGPLTNPEAHGGEPADAFDVVVPSLPGFGFGGKPVERGWGPARMGRAFDRLIVDDPGYRRYGVQGGDWGGLIAARMGAENAGRVEAIHVNLAFGAPPKEMDDKDREALEKRNQFQARETGYSNVQGTKPMSLGIAQADSPAGIAAWITEKFRTWSDCDGDVESSYTKDQLLTNIMFYWLPNSIASAARIYYEAQRDGGFAVDKVEVPTAVAAFPKEVVPMVRGWVEPRFNLKHWTEMPRGGHFAALEEPELLLADIRDFFREFRQ